MDTKNQELLDKAIELSLEDLVNAENADEKSRALDAATKLIDRKNEADKIEDSKNGSKINIAIQVAGLVGTLVIAPTVKYFIDRKHINQICKLEQIDTLVSSPGKGLVRSWFQFR